MSAMRFSVLAKYSCSSRSHCSILLSAFSSTRTKPCVIPPCPPHSPPPPGQPVACLFPVMPTTARQHGTRQFDPLSDHHLTSPHTRRATVPFPPRRGLYSGFPLL